MPFCTNCGAPLIPDAKFCPSCGTSVKTVPEKPAQEIKQETTEDAAVLPAEEAAAQEQETVLQEQEVPAAEQEAQTETASEAQEPVSEAQEPVEAAPETTETANAAPQQVPPQPQPQPQAYAYAAAQYGQPNYNPQYNPQYAAGAYPGAMPNPVPVKPPKEQGNYLGLAITGIIFSVVLSLVGLIICSTALLRTNEFAGQLTEKNKKAKTIAFIGVFVAVVVTIVAAAVFVANFGRVLSYFNSVMQPPVA